MGTAFTVAKTSSASWDAFSDVDAFIDAVLAELGAMAADDIRSTRSRPKPQLIGVVLRKPIMAIWLICFCGMQWRAIGLLCDIPLGPLYMLLARWTWLGLHRRLTTDGHFFALIEIIFISILFLRLIRLATPEITAWRLQTDFQAAPHLLARGSGSAESRACGTVRMVLRGVNIDEIPFFVVLRCAEIG